ncbi:septum formation inhibitor Maf [Steroidobacter sp. S1-65]|uniref:dTTP/UTP pyrophosphatase n=1 Tax=Steroidobacter gossypii TaxID=2805490 RepID=A0ABS1X5A5_9GAMM|nr:Maf family protein [Steroidobacter gossypii]MBM0108394.1 septum formation inhibitor Maf [Steroidobacter gossypii]
MSALPSSSAKPLIYLASASPRRSALLAQIGVAHRVAPVDIDESVGDAEPPEKYVTRLATLKADTLWHSLPAEQRLPVLGSDTSVVVDGSILGKPADEQDCVRMLQLLSGRTHQVHTAVAMRSAAGSDVRLSVSDVTFRELTLAEMRAYWRSGEPADKAGGYAVQGRGAVFIRHIAGSYSGIMGLPLFETAELLAAHQIISEVQG